MTVSLRTGKCLNASLSRWLSRQKKFKVGGGAGLVLQYDYTHPGGSYHLTISIAFTGGVQQDKGFDSHLKVSVLPQDRFAI